MDRVDAKLRKANQLELDVSNVADLCFRTTEAYSRLPTTMSTVAKPAVASSRPSDAGERAVAPCRSCSLD